MMKLKKLLCGALSGLIMSASSLASAYGMFWYDMSTDLPMWKKVVIFPLSNAWEKDRFLISTDENSLLYWENKYLMERFDKKIKNMHTIRLAPGIAEKGAILIDKYSMLLQPYPNEQARAAAVFEQTGADMYIIPQFTKKYVHKDVSPSIEADIELKSWTEETDGPDGNKTYDEKKWTEHHVMPARPVYTSVTELSYTGYDTKANKVMLFSDIRHGGGDAKHVFRDISKYLRKEFSEIKSGDREKKNKAGVITIGFKNINVPSNYDAALYSIGNQSYPSMEAAYAAFNRYKNGNINVDMALDELAVKSIYYAAKVTALEELKGVRIIADSSSNEPVDYYITGTVTRWQRYWHWTAPSIGKTTETVKTEESKWTDKNGKEHKKKTTYYKEKVVEHYGGWSVRHNVTAGFALVDAKTGQSVVYSSFNDSDDRMMDAYRHSLEQFCKQVKDYFKGRNKN